MFARVALVLTSRPLLGFLLKATVLGVSPAGERIPIAGGTPALHSNCVAPAFRHAPDGSVEEKERGTGVPLSEP